MPIISGVCGTVGDAVTDGLIGALGDVVAKGAASLFRGMWSLMSTTTFVDVTSGEYVRVYNLVFGIAVVMMLGFFLLQLITGMLRREPGALARAALGLGKAMLGSFVALTLTATLLEVVDRLCIAIVEAAGTTMEELGERVALVFLGGGVAAMTAPGLTFLFAIFVGAAAIGATFILWISLLVRKALLLLAVAFAPMAMAGGIWDATRSWGSRWASFVIALALSKLVIVVMFLLAAAQASTPISGDLASLSEPLTAVVLMLIAGFAPYMTYKVINFMGFDMYHAMSAEQEAKHSLNRHIPMPTPRLSSPPMKILGNRTGSMGAPPGPSATGASGASAGAASGAAAATGVGAAAVAGANLLKGAATAGPKAGATLAGAAEQHTGSTGSRSPTTTTTARPNPGPATTPPTTTPSTPKES
ncbi:conjugal transfer protein TrbL [Xylanimonas ulmi]|uniref:conjugal transfer protein TrbL n=1 Tax=Xylanimonas ulmi TaxID=228973 RepID=UPI001F5F2BCC|nr:conjugal transfer protein TrbL [Xylanibacterium ulmi]